jgi:hypothetical protein
MTQNTPQQSDRPGIGNSAEGPEVEFLDLNTNREYRFHVRWSDTLQSALDTAYTKIREARTDEDKLLCGDNEGASLMAYLAFTFEKLRDEKICPDRKYKLRRKTGGA